MGQSGNRGQVFLIQGVLIAPLILNLLNIGNSLSIEAVSSILDQTQIIGVDRHGISGNDLLYLRLVYMEMGGEIIRVGDTGGKFAQYLETSVHRSTALTFFTQKFLVFFH